MKAKNFDQQFDDGTDITSFLDLSKAKRVLQNQKRVNVDFPEWIIKSLDAQSRNIGVSRQSLIKLWISERLQQERNVSA